MNLFLPILFVLIIKLSILINPVLSTPVWVEPTTYESCPYEGTRNITFRNYCEMFMSCNNGVSQLVTCPDGLHFNPRDQSCDFPKNVRNCETLDKFAVTTAKPTPQLVEQIKQNFECEPVDIIVKKRGRRRCKVQIICANGISFMLRKCMQTISFRL